MSRFLGIVASLLAVMAAAPLVRAAEGPAERLFHDRCNACHSVGGGDLAGPDLMVAQKLADQTLRAAVMRMQEHAGPMTASEIDTLVALLKDPAAKERIAGRVEPPPPVVELGSPSAGRMLFYGDRRLQNGGVACSACHTADGRGGNLGRDLTASHSRLGDAGLLGIAERPAFPMMKTAYAAHPLTHAEAMDVTAFLRSTAKNSKPNTNPRSERTGVLHGAATGVALVFFAGVFVLFRSRPAARSRRTR